MTDSVAIHVGADAWTWLTDDQSVREWARLYEQCPWATAYQSSDFVVTWLQSYRTRYSPVIVVEYDATLGLCGLLCLAQTVEDGTLVVAGAHQAEYHVWLSEANDPIEFAESALAAVGERFPGRDLSFTFIPGEFPLESLRRLVARFPLAEITVRDRPLMRIDPAELDESFRKKSNKSRFNRLKALGELEFTRVTTVSQLAALLDEIADQYDFRQAAAHGVRAFRDDPLKKPFHLALLARDPNLLQVTVTTVNGRPIAAHFGVAGKGQVHLAIITFSPAHARYSTGKLHLMQLGRALAREEVAVLDLTPGGEPWKERFANAHDHVFELVVYGGHLTRAKRAWRLRLGVVAREGLARFGFTPGAARDAYARLRRISAKGAVRYIGRLLRQRTEARIYRYETATLEHTPLDGRFHRDSLGDLLKFQMTDRDRTAEIFLTNAMTRLEAGEHAYTYASGDRLLHSGWLVDQQDEAFLNEVGARYRFPPRSAVLYDFFTDPSARGQGLYRASLRRMLADAALQGVQFVYIVVLADNAPSRHVIEGVGFTYQTSLFQSVTLGRRNTTGETTGEAAPRPGTSLPAADDGQQA